MDYRLFSNIINLDEVDSTNNYIRRESLACNPAIRNGLVVVARTQTAGRGRKNRSWYSGKNMSLTFSFLMDLSSKKPTEITTLTLAAGVAVSAAMTDLGITSKVKWPNDVFVENRKICGILSETINIGGKLSAICGIGININLDNRALKSIGAPATSVYAETSKKYNPCEILPIVLQQLDQWLGIWLKEPIEAITARWTQSAYGLGKSLQVVEDGQVLDEGFFAGLGQQGQFVIRRYNGEKADIWAGDIIWQ